MRKKTSRKPFRVIRNKGLEQAERSGKITAAEVKEIWLAGQAEERQMAQLCPEFNALMELLWRRSRELLQDHELVLNNPQLIFDDHNMHLWSCLMMARIEFFERRAWVKQQQLKLLSK